MSSTTTASCILVITTWRGSTYRLDTMDGAEALRETEECWNQVLKLTGTCGKNGTKMKKKKKKV